VAVTRLNRRAYVDAYCDYYLNKSIRGMFNAFRRGFFCLLPASPLLMMSPSDLELILCGTSHFDTRDLEKNARYEGFGSSSSSSSSSNSSNRVSSNPPSIAAIKHLWSVLHSFTPAQQHKFLHFISGSSRVPVGGGKDIKLTIVHGGNDQAKLPLGKTCFNSLVLPSYKEEETLRKKLLLAIEEGTEGFSLQ